MPAFWFGSPAAICSFAVSFVLAACSYTVSPAVQEDSKVKTSASSKKTNTTSTPTTSQTTTNSTASSSNSTTGNTTSIPPVSPPSPPYEIPMIPLTPTVPTDSTNSVSGSASVPCSQRQAPAGWMPVRNIAELIAINNDPNASYLQLCDLDLQSVNWVPITRIRGVFDGNSFTISNLHNEPLPASFSAASTQAGFYALFSENMGIIRNVKIKNINLNSTSQSGYMGGIAAVNSDGALIDGCEVDGRFVTWHSTAGGIAGFNIGQIKNSNSSVAFRLSAGNPKAVPGYIGGITGNTIGPLENIKFSGSITAETTTVGVGGIAGIAQATSRRLLRITKAVNSANIITTGESSQIGGLVGNFGCNQPTAADPCEITDSFSSGQLTAKYMLGGLVGYALANSVSNLRITNSGVTGGTIHGSYMVGGLIGKGDSPLISGSSVKATLIADGASDSAVAMGCSGLVVSPFSYVGGLVGELDFANSGGIPPVIRDCSFEGNIQSKLNVAGGIVGIASRRFIIERTQAKGSIKGGNFIGGFIGFISAQEGVTTITDSSAQVDIDAMGYSGLFMGHLAPCPGTAVRIKNVFAAGNSSLSSPQIPIVPSQLEIMSSYYLATSDAPSNKLAGIPKTQVELGNPGTFIGWDLVQFWGLATGGASYPSLLKP